MRRRSAERDAGDGRHLYRSRADGVTLMGSKGHLAALLVQAGTAGNGARHQNEHHDDDEKTAVSEVGVLVEDTAPVFGPMPIAR